MEINLLTDDQGRFNSSVRMYQQENIVSMNLDKLVQFSNLEGIRLNIIPFSEITFDKDYSFQYFVYTSSEDPLLIYKSYLEDILYCLKLRGAILIPEWHYMRAHHNKVMMELLRETKLENINTGIHSMALGCNEGFERLIDRINFPCVYKSAAGAGSNGVALLQNKKQALDFLRKAHTNHHYTLREKVSLRLGRRKLPYYSNYRQKFVIQNFIPGLEGDFKVLIFGEKYYALSRKNRKNDFRASGGGQLNYEPILPNGILDFASSIFSTLHVPILSLDIAYDGRQFYLIEFQCLNFGTATLENSSHYYTKEGNEWQRHDKPSILEQEYIHSLKKFIQANIKQ